LPKPRRDTPGIQARPRLDASHGTPQRRTLSRCGAMHPARRRRRDLIGSRHLAPALGALQCSGVAVVGGPRLQADATRAYGRSGLQLRPATRAGIARP